MENNRDFLVTTDPALRAQHEKELSHQEATELYQQALQLKAQDPETLNRKITILKKVIEIEPDFFQPICRLDWHINCKTTTPKP